MRFKKISKWIHKYLGLLLILFLVWMSVSGILLNHPEMISGISVPAIFVPPQYHIENWERGALSETVFPAANPQIAIASGKEGIWISYDRGRSFNSFMGNGYPEGSYDRKTSSILLLEAGPNPLVLACTYGGLYYRNLSYGPWRRIDFSTDDERPIRALQASGRLLLFTEDNIYATSDHAPPFNFRKITPARAGESNVTLIKLFFDLHSGANFGMPGKLIYDAAGLVLVILCITAFYTWYYPKKLKLRLRFRMRNRAKRPKVFLFLLRYHLHLGIWSALLLLIIGATGLFMRPPFIAAIAEKSMPAKYYPGMLPDNPWYQKIRNAAYNPSTGDVLIDCRDGMYAGSFESGEPFHKQTMPVDVFVMGATVMNFDADGTLLLGSFNGLYLVDLEQRRAIDVSNGAEAEYVSSMRPGEYMITGYFQTPDHAHFITTHDSGLLHVSGRTTYGPFPMPCEKLADQSMPLWNYLFELHNGRLFQDFIHDWYILLVPLGSLLSCLLVVTGIVDWFVVRNRQRRAVRRSAF